MNRKAPTMIEAYETFMKQTEGKVKLFATTKYIDKKRNISYNVDEEYNADICRGIYCDKLKCRIACGELRKFRMERVHNKNKIKQKRND